MAYACGLLQGIVTHVARMMAKLKLDGIAVLNEKNVASIDDGRA